MIISRCSYHLMSYSDILMNDKTYLMLFIILSNPIFRA